VTPEPQVVKLKNGAEVPQPLIITTMLALEALETGNPIALIEPAAACRDKGHVMFGRTGSAAMELALIESQSFDGTVKVFDSTRDILLSAAIGEGWDLTLGSPLAGER
jgi:hypothetical protein